MSKAAKQSLFILVFLLIGSVIYAGKVSLDKDKLSKENKKLSQELSQVSKSEKSLKEVSSKLKQDLETQAKIADEQKREYQKKITSAETRVDKLLKDIDTVTKDRDKWERRIESVKNERDNLLAKLKEKPEPQIIYKERPPEPKAEPEPEKIEKKAPAIAMPKASYDQRTTVVTRDDGNEEYWASVLRVKAELEIELKKLKDEVTSHSVEVVEVTRENNELKVKLDILNHEKEEVDREIAYKENLVNSLSLELARSKNDKKFVSDRVDKVTAENSSLRQQLGQLVSTKGALEKTIVRLTQEKRNIESQLGKTDGLIQSKIDEIWEIKESIDRAFKSTSDKVSSSSEVELPPIVVSANGGPGISFNPGETSPGYDGRVVSINEENNFVIVDIGEGSGINVGDNLSVYRDSQYIARLEVIQVRTDISAADIRDQWSRLKAGDVVR
ncbi:MAG: hypothetical protein KJ736_10455 [Candidatus Omnitrophica bacterium]|nr:hypothetical protein [Candidatus Omnitrophota bacterium]